MRLKISRKGIIIIIVILIIILVILVLWKSHSYIKNNVKSGGVEINKFLDQHCSDGAVFNPKDFPWTDEFRKNWTVIRDEVDNYQREYIIPAYKDVNKDSAGNIPGWKALFLRVFNNDTDILKLFPKTNELLNKCHCTSAYFSMMEPGTKLPPHKGVYKGVLRYHLGLRIPKDWENCFIVVDNKKLHWKDGEDIMFDDMFTHHVENNTQEQRMILFMDVKRDFKNPMVNLVNRIMLKFIKSNDALINGVKIANSISRTKIGSYQPVQSSNSSNTSTVDRLNNFRNLVANTPLIPPKNDYE